MSRGDKAFVVVLAAPVWLAAILWLIATLASPFRYLP